MHSKLTISFMVNLNHYSLQSIIFMLKTDSLAKNDHRISGNLYICIYIYIYKYIYMYIYIHTKLIKAKQTLA